MRSLIGRALLFAVALLFFTSPAAAAERAILTLVVNGLEHEPVPVELLGEDATHPTDAVVPRSALEALGIMTRGSSAHVRVSTIQGATFRLDERTLTLRIDVPLSAFRGTELDLAQRAPANIVYRRDTSAFFNYAPRLVGFKHAQAYGEAGVSAGGALLFSSASISEGYGAVRGLSNVTIDEREDLRRWIAGDSVVTSGPLGGAVTLGGLSVGRSFDLDPYLARVPTLSTTGTVVTPSTLDVYVNGALVRREPVAPGAFTVQNLPVPSGAGATRYVLRDVFGREQSFGSPYYAAGGLLRPGLVDYGFAGGLRREDLAADSFGYTTPAGMGRYRAGITRSLTLGARGEIAPGLATGGPTATVGLPFGQVEMAAAGSTANGRGGLAGLLSYVYTSRRFGVGAVGRVATDAYSNVSMPPAQDRPLVDASAFLSVPVGRRVTISNDYALSRTRDGNGNARIGIATTVQIDRSLSFSANASRSVLSDGTAPFDTYASLTYVFANGTSASANARTRASEVAATAEVNRPFPVTTGVAYRASVTRGSVDEGHAMAAVQTEIGRAQASVDAWEGRPATVTLEGAGSIIAVDGGGVFLARPVTSGFAVVQVPGVENASVDLNNHEVARTNRSGNAVVLNVLPYYGNRLRVGGGDLPLDVDVASDEQIVAPPYRGGVLVRFAAKRTAFVRGTLKVRSPWGVRIPKYGELRVEGMISPIGDDGTFELEEIAAGRHPARIVDADGACELTIEVPLARGPVTHLESVECSQP